MAEPEIIPECCEGCGEWKQDFYGGVCSECGYDPAPAEPTFKVGDVVSFSMFERGAWTKPEHDLVIIGFSLFDKRKGVAIVASPKAHGMPTSIDWLTKTGTNPLRAKRLRARYERLYPGMMHP